METSTKAEQGEEVLALRAEVERLRSEQQRFRDAVDRELIRKEYRIGELEQALHRSAQGYEASLSWKVTKPLRAAKAALRNLRHD